ncbi:MAG TPA: 2-C-methyl-D-erythritol 2,4-cyclodiphosphate synthase [Bacteroidales bacterium]|jgi:2-C-methyl-D-erythritol 2,4-cyclodiphosphate synthase|nr:2-C-methyl-D-erythritol 2,4-cyclodiphosphate synthase [Bacteroidales bacterium]HKM12412.1 2-C-methyl-D-erythritol 2,4-cyclodiphosphate synthase [Bacteroidales bacterium]HPB89174.1 2-C-methyl-D-erythritol 2,4-cyclodiphosphate synthase [Bacteroidales bacterium]HPY21833.1 2-C-methyl-D-erythritol 2,4-cyclodiphosphate synthase [Bacteroidales bacterium]HQN23841.1 2-C-methyl-D-erythritol 2,4-cyclodiphosphate synthase [Bacteroidales bacterium]
MDIRIGNGFDIHKLASGLPLRLCGVTIPSEKGCVAHSDGDVAIHALCDALLGALALGDIGKYFPDTSDEYKGIDSRILLKSVLEMITERGWRIGNIDITLMLQKPKVAPYILEMRKMLASVLDLDLERVSVKATTTEKLGSIGREEGIATFATILLFN